LVAYTLAMSLLLVVAPVSFAQAHARAPVPASANDLRVDASGQAEIVQKITGSGKIEAIRRMSVQRAARLSLRPVPADSGLLADCAENMADSATKSVALCGQAAFNQVTFTGWAGRAPPLSTT
tara:strand:- start:182 stop:550 length:369 start_codon:yes stop_codon:yes gene_type:complete